jgi:hypothetical protein
MKNEKSDNRALVFVGCFLFLLDCCSPYGIPEKSDIGLWLVTLVLESHGIEWDLMKSCRMSWMAGCWL